MDRCYWLTQGLNDKGKIVPADKVEVAQQLSAIIKTQPNSDWYKSLFYFGPEALEHFTKTASMAGYKGTSHSNRLVWDFDSENVESSRNDCIELLSRLSDEGVDVYYHAKVYFSGNKGFHVELLTKENFTPEEMKVICSNLAQGLSTFDTVIYNSTRKYRIENTLNKKSNLFKIEIPLEEIQTLTVQQIKERASAPVNYRSDIQPLLDSALLEKYKKKKKVENLVVSNSGEEVNGVRGINSIDFTKCPRHTPRCIFALEKGVMKPGERQVLLYRLATYYRNQGMEKEVAHRTLKGVAELNARLYPEHDAITKEEIWHQAIASSYGKDLDQKYVGHWGTSPDNELVEKYCNMIKSGRPCILHSKSAKTSRFVKIAEVSDSFKDFAENFDKNSIKTGIELIDKHMNITVGTTTLLVGATGSGKTTVALNIMENANKLGLHTMFFSLDMHHTLVYLKLAMKLTGYSKDEILLAYRNKDVKKIDTIREVISKKYDKTFFDFSKTMTMEDMMERIQEAEEKSGQKIKLVVCDYAGRVAGPFSDSYANARHNALKSVEVAERTDAAWIFISQISRNTGDGSTPLRTKRAAKESGDWEESATNVITMWRPFMGRAEEDDVVRIFLAKNRMGAELERPLWWDGEKCSIRDMTEVEYLEYKEMREEAEEQRRTFRS